MPFVYVPESAGLSRASALSFLACVLFASWSRILTASEFSACATLEPLSGTTWPPGRPGSGAEPTCSRQASPASPGVLQALEMGSMTRAGSGLSLRQPFARFDRDTLLWRTSQASLLEGWDTFSQTWPSWGMLARGEAFPAKPWKPRSAGSASSPSSLWQTPIACEDEGSGFRSRGTPKLSGQGKIWATPMATDAQKGPINNHSDLTRDVQQWESARPTPTARDWKSGYIQDPTNSRPLSEVCQNWPTPTAQSYGTNQSLSPGAAIRPSLDTLAKTWPTPKACIDKAGRPRSADRGDLQAAALEFGRPGQVETGAASRPSSGRLNPAFVEWLMGFPPGYSDPSVELDSRRWETACLLLLQDALGLCCRPCWSALALRRPQA